MRARFVQDVIATKVSRVCCSSGLGQSDQVLCKSGEEVEAISVVNDGPCRKMKSRPGVPGVRAQHVTIYLKNERAESTYPDRIEGIPSGAIRIIS